MTCRGFIARCVLHRLERGNRVAQQEQLHVRLTSDSQMVSAHHRGKDYVSGDAIVTSYREAQTVSRLVHRRSSGHLLDEHQGTNAYDDGFSDISWLSNLVFGLGQTGVVLWFLNGATVLPTSGSPGTIDSPLSNPVHKRRLRPVRFESALATSDRPIDVHLVVRWRAS